MTSATDSGFFEQLTLGLSKVLSEYTELQHDY